MSLKSLQAQNGMTLLEVLIATTILTILSALAFVSIDNMVKAKVLIKEHTDQLNQENLAVYMLQNDLQYAVSGYQNTVTKADFIGSSQGFSLLRYQSEGATSTRIELTKKTAKQSLQRIRWYLKGQQLVRASQPANGIINSNQWQERNYLTVNSWYCQYRNEAGVETGQWPNSPIENSRLPRMVNCSIVMQSGEETAFKLVPWEQI